MRARRRAAAIGALALVLTLAGCKDLEETAVARDRCHELGGEFYAEWDAAFDRYHTSCDLSDPKED